MVDLNENIAKYLVQQSFYHGYLPREDMVFILKKKGDYILRTTERQTAKGRRRDLVISVGCPSDKSIGPLELHDIKNILIERSPTGGVYIDSKNVFPEMNELITYYQNNNMKMRGEAGIKLLRPIGLMSWEYKHTQILLTKKVGQGAYGEVFKGKVKKGKKSFVAAIKSMKSDQDMNGEKMKEVMAEARLMRMMNHPNIVRIRGIAVLEQPLYIIIDFISGGGLDSYLKKNASKLTDDDKNKMAISAAWGIEFMHLQNILHRDIAARNCLYDEKNYVKLSDFGLSRKGDTYKMKNARKMPTKWLAPESLQTFMFSRASDVYTYGVLLYEIYMCAEPFADINGGEARKRVMAGKFPDFQKKAPPELWTIVQEKVYVLDPKKRAPMADVVKSLEEWLQVELVLEADEIDKEQETTVMREEVKSDPKKRSKRRTTPNIALGEVKKGPKDGTIDTTVDKCEDAREKEVLKPETVTTTSSITTSTASMSMEKLQTAESPNPNPT